MFPYPEETSTHHRWMVAGTEPLRVIGAWLRYGLSAPGNVLSLFVLFPKPHGVRDPTAELLLPLLGQFHASRTHRKC